MEALDKFDANEATKKRWKDKLLSVREGEINRENLKTMVHDMCVTAFTENVDSSSTNNGLYLQLASKAAIISEKYWYLSSLHFPM